MNNLSTQVKEWIIRFKDGVEIPITKPTGEDLVKRSASGGMEFFTLNAKTFSFHKVDYIGSKADYLELYPEKATTTLSDYSKPISGDEESYVVREVSEKLKGKLFGDVHSETIRRMYRDWKEATDKKAFLVKEGAITSSGAVICDFPSPYGESVVFKYYAYGLIQSAIGRHEARDKYIEERDWGGILDRASQPSHIEAFAKGLKKAKEAKTAKNQDTTGIDRLIETARIKYQQLKDVQTRQTAGA